MSLERIHPTQIIPSLLEAARQGDWERIDQKLLPQLPSLDQNAAANEMLTYTNDENDDVRDLSATALTALHITDPLTLALSVGEMSTMASEDQHVFAAGRAATFLIKHRKDEKYGKPIEAALEQFKKRVKENEWSDDIKENIPQLSDLIS